MRTLAILIWSALTIGLVHALAPDHWLPVAMIGRARKWSVPRLLGITLLAGVGHIMSSVVIGGIGIAAGLALARVQRFEGSRAQIAGLLLIGFGIAYAVWGLKQARRHHLEERSLEAAVTVWVLVAVFVLGPCEPLIPLMFLAIARGWHAVALTTLVFGLATIGVMLVGTLLAFRGASAARFQAFERYNHAIAGALIAITGLAVMLLGI